MHISPHGIEPANLFQSTQLLKAYERAINANVISSITDRQGVIVYANQKFSDVSKFEIDAIVGQNHKIINSGYHTKEFFRDLWKTIANGDVWHGEIRNKASDGSFYWVDTVIVPIKDQEEKITHYLSLRTLITDKKKLEEKKLNYVASLEVLLVMTSHQIKKPLSECLKQIKALDADKPIIISDLKPILERLTQAAGELDSFSRELNVFIRDMDKEVSRNEAKPGIIPKNGL